jgi:hypothetical protein
MKKSIILVAALTGLIVTSCRKIEMDGGTSTVITTPPITTGQTIILSGRISKDTLLKASNTYILSGLVYMVNNATMTIEPGTTIKGDFQGSNVAALTITRGAKIVASGTQDNPIVFTSNSPVPRSGDWGGLVLCGKASINTATGGSPGTFTVEGGVDNSFGDGIAGGGATPNDDDSSGVLKYVRIEYAGYAYQPDRELNSLTMCAVGRKTVIDYVQVTYAKDDAFEWFGGTVNCKHLIAYKTQDDDFDTDNGYSGNVQFGIALRDSTIADISRSEAFESDNDASGSTNSPQTRAVFSNMTVIGPRATLANTGNSLFLCGAQIRRNSGISIFNSIFLGWGAGLLIDSRLGKGVENNIADSTTRFKNNTIAGCGPLVPGVAPALADGTSMQFISGGINLPGWTTSATGTDLVRARFLQGGVGTVYPFNVILTNTSQALLIAPFNYVAPDFVPFGGSNGNQDILVRASFTDPKLTNPFFQKTLAQDGSALKFRGACAPAGIDANWWRGWTRFVN